MTLQLQFTAPLIRKSKTQIREQGVPEYQEHQAMKEKKDYTITKTVADRRLPTTRYFPTKDHFHVIFPAISQLFLRFFWLLVKTLLLLGVNWYANSQFRSAPKRIFLSDLDEIENEDENQNEDEDEDENEGENEDQYKKFKDKNEGVDEDNHENENDVEGKYEIKMMRLNI